MTDHLCLTQGCVQAGKELDDLKTDPCELLQGMMGGKILILTGSESEICQSLAGNKLFRGDLMQGQIFRQKEQIQKISMMFKT